MNGLGTFTLGFFGTTVTNGDPLTTLIQDYVVTYGTGSTHIPASQYVYAHPSTSYLFVQEQISGAFYEVSPPVYRYAIPDPTTGQVSLFLPWPSACDPSTVIWTIQLPDGSRLSGTVPEGNAGPLTFKDLKDSHGWSIA